MIIPLCDLTRKWTGTPYGETDCINFVHDFLSEALGRPVPDSWGDLNTVNYLNRWRQNRQEVEQQLCQAVQAHTTASDPKHPKLLDLLVVEIRNDCLTPAVYVGNGNAITCFIKSGVRVFNLDKHNRAIISGTLT